MLVLRVRRAVPEFPLCYTVYFQPERPALTPPEMMSMPMMPPNAALIKWDLLG